jgi:hypothetical protein
VTIIITDDDVQRLLSREDGIEAMRVAFARLGSGRSSLDAAGYRPSP